MNVLHLITSTRSFFEQQIEVLESRGVSCTVVGVPGEYRANAPRSPADYARYYPRVLREVRNGSYDLVHGHYGLVAPFALSQPCRPVALTLWGTDLMSDMRWLRVLSRVGARLADATIIPSPAMAEYMTTGHEIIPFGVDTDRFRPIDRETARAHLGWGTDRPVALFPYDPARPEKNYALARQVIEDVEGEVELRTVIDAPYEDMPFYMNASDLLLLTSTRESGPMAVKEAVACNVPVVATDVGFVRETLEDVRNCAVCTSRRGLVGGVEAVLTDGGRSNGRASVADLGLDRMGDQLIAVYERLLDDAPDGSPVPSVRDDLHGS